MCGRYTLEKDIDELEQWFEAAIEEKEGLEPNYNVALTHQMPVVRQKEDSRVIELRMNTRTKRP